MQVYFVSLGCDKNLVDSEIMLGIINEEGYKITQAAEEANVIIINTCGFIADANSEGVETILQMAEYKKSGNCKAIIVTGCMAQRYKEEIFKELPEVDAIVGVGDFEEIGRVIKEAELASKDGKKISIINDNNKTLKEESRLKRIISTPSYFAYLKIAEGCDNLCTYCTIPSIRGNYRSRKIESILEEAEILVQKGVKEIILVAQDTSLYGTDIYNENMLHTLLQKLSEIEGLSWIRLMYCYPEHITEQTINEMSSNNKVCKYIDMPIQHSDDNVLKRMGRKSTNNQLLNVIQKLRSKMSDIIIRTTLIVGFPGETEEEFENLYNFVKDVRFDRLGVFEYSQEEGTPAAKMKNQIDKQVKSRRKDDIMRIQMDISHEKSNNLIGKIFKVIVDGKLPEEDVYCGRSYMDCYDIDGMVFFESDDELIAGDFVTVKITKASDYDLIGEVINELT